MHLKIILQLVDDYEKDKVYAEEIVNGERKEATDIIKEINAVFQWFSVIGEQRQKTLDKGKVLPF